MKKKVVRATEFQLVNDDGLPRASLSVNPDNMPNLRFLDAEGMVRLDLFLQGDGRPLINMNARNSSCRVALGLLDNGNPVLTLYDKKQRPVRQYEVVEKKGEMELVHRKFRCR
jgi:hypothetical protein